MRFAPALLALVPMYAAYRYFMIDDAICVVDPETYTVVDVISDPIEEAGPIGPAGPSAPLAVRPPPPALALSGSQRRCVYETTPQDVPRADVHARLALGAEVPPTAELFEFPQEAADCAPDITAYRYIVTENDDLVVVDPVDRSVALVISP